MKIVENWSKEINDNRIQLAKKLKIHKWKKLTKRDRQFLNFDKFNDWAKALYFNPDDYEKLDHTETYKCKDGSMIVISSPYGPNPMPKGWIQIPPVYPGIDKSYLIHYHGTRLIDDTDKFT